MKDVYFWPSALCVNKDDIWFIYGKIPVLCKYNISDKKVDVICGLPNDDIYRESLYEDMIFVNNKLFIIPCWADNIIVYSVETGELVTLEIEKSNILKFSKAFLYGEKIICVPYAYSYILSVDVNNLFINIEYDLEDIKKANNIIYFNDCGRIDDENIIIVSPQNKRIFVYNIKYKTISNLSNGENENLYSSVVITENYIFICSNRDRSIVRYSVLLKKITGEWWPDNKEMISIMSGGNKEIIVDDVKSSWVGIYDENFQLINEDCSNEIDNRDLYYSYMHGISKIDNGITYYFNNANATLVTYIDGQVKIKEKIIITEECKHKIQKIVMENYKENVLYESDLFSVCSYVKAL